MGYMRGHPEDYQAWVDATGDARWSWASLLPVFDAIEDRPDGKSGGPSHGPTRDSGLGASSAVAGAQCLRTLVSRARVCGKPTSTCIIDQNDGVGSGACLRLS